MMGIIIRKLLLLAALVTYIHGVCGNTDFSSITGMKFHQPTAEEMQRAHEAFSSQGLQNKTAMRYMKRSEAKPATIKLRDVSTSQLQQAKALVAAAQASQAAYNKWNIENPRFNNYHHKRAGEAPLQRRENGMSPPNFSQEILDAIRLVGDVDAQDMHNNGTLPNYDGDAKIQTHTSNIDTNFYRNGTSKRAGGGPWMSQMQHVGTQPFGGDSTYQVWRSVTDFGAVGDGVADDTDAINRAISNQTRCGANCAGSTVKGAVVYFPYGVYRITSSIISYYDTQIVGEIEPSLGGMPVIQAAPTFTGNGVFSSDVYLADGTSEWYVNTANFYRQIRNLNIDLRLANMQSIKGIHWQVGQATSIENVNIYLTAKSSSTQIGIFSENGSGGWFSDITIEGGLYGFLGGNQQYSVSNIGVSQAKNGIGIIWDWAWSWSHLSLIECDVGIDLTPPGASAAAPVGSVMIVDSIFTNCVIAVQTYKFTSTIAEQGTTVLSFNNVGFKGCSYFIAFPDGTYLSQDVSNLQLGYWQMGDLEASGETHDGFFTVNVNRPAALTISDSYSSAENSFFRRPKPLYLQTPASSFLNAKTLAKGDGQTDDTSALQTMLYYCAQNNCILYVPAGSYMISSPILIPDNSFIVGEAWSQFVAYGSTFADELNPAPMVTVGQGGDGTVEMQNILFTSQGALPGLVLVQWNIKAKTQGSVGMWDCHFRVGGAKGTNLQTAQCPKLSGSINSQCIAGSIMLLMTPDSDGYFENMWAWVADHDIDNPNSDMSNQIDVYFARGVLIQSQGPSWFRGTASEHSVLFQYNIVNASNIYMSIIQTESPYYQGAANTQAPTPFTSPLWNGDPLFDMCGENTTSCNVAWAIIIQWSDYVFIDGAGLYSWFQSYNEGCVNTRNCQQRLVNIYHVGHLLFNHLTTIGSVEVLTPAISNVWNDIKYSADHLQATGYPWWATIATYLESSDAIDLTTASFPVNEGWVAFGDSYAAGIGAGKPIDDKKACARGTGGYPPILNDIIKFSHNVETNFQPLACTGETAQDFLDGNGGEQILNWAPSSSDIGTCSFTGNDLGFGDIVAHCIMGYKSRDPCQGDIANAQSILETNKVGELVSDVMDKILAAASSHKGRFMVYWTGYPRFFTVVDSTCDSCWFHEYWYAGEYLTTGLRNKLNELSVEVNDQIDFAIRKYNALLPYPKVVFVSPDALGNIYDGKRFCEKSVSEPLKGDSQKAVAFFYEKGGDDIPDAPFHLPAQNNGAPSDWSFSTYNSASCSDSVPASPGDWASEMLCDTAIGIANGTITAQDFLDNEGTGAIVTANNDGSVTITNLDVAYTKMFHPKTRANWHIAQAISDALRTN